MALTDRVETRIRVDSTDVPSFWSRDDAKFAMTAPFLVGAATLCPETSWHQAARFIEAIGSVVDNHKNSSQLIEVVSERLGVSAAKLCEIIILSRINRTEHFIHVVASLLKKRWRPRSQVIGREHLDEALAEGRGAVIWVAHFAFASLFTKMALSDAGYKISHISRPEHGVSKSRFGIEYLNWFRCAAENRYLEQRIVHLRDRPEATSEAALAALRRNELLSVTVGAWEGRHLATGELLGSNYTVSAGAPAFAFATGAKLLSVFTTQDNDSGSYHIAIGAPIGETSRSSREQFIRASMLELLSRHESAIRYAPEQWRGWGKLSPRV